MFTGIIKNIGVIKELTKKNNGYFLSVISNLNFNKKLGKIILPETPYY